MQSIQTTKLSNGITVVTENIPTVHSFSIGFWFNVGSRDENSRTAGISHFLEHMLFKGTHKRSAKKIAESVESVGGYLNAFTSKEHTCFYGRGLVEHLPMTFDILADLVQNPKLKPSDIDKERGVILDEFKDIQDTPSDLIFDVFEESLFKGNMLSSPIIGTEKNISGFDHETLAAYHTRHYGTNNLVIVCSGRVEHDKMVALAEKNFSSRKASPGKRKRAIAVQPVSKSIVKDITQVHCILGRNSYGYESDERVKLSMLSGILGGGTSSRLYQAVRERSGSTYQINTFVNSYLDTSAFGIYFSTGPEQKMKVLSVIEREIKNLAEKGINVRELKRIKELKKGGLVMGLESTTNRMMRIASSILNHGRIIPVEEVLEKINAVTQQELNIEAKRLLESESFLRIFIESGPEQKRA